MSDAAAAARLSPTAIPLAEAARLISKVSGQTVTTEMLQTDVDLGAPTNPDGSFNLVHYAAWLIREAANGAGA